MKENCRSRTELIPGAILLLAAMLRINGLFSELQYDEIWSLQYFIPLDVFKILTDLALPNNHPVNTLILKFLHGISYEPAFLRMGVFLSGLVTVWLAGKIAETASGEKNAGFAAMLLCAVSPALILFSVTARGYSYQVTGLLLVIYALLRCARNETSRYTIATIVGGGILSCLSVPSGIMFLGTIGAGYLLFAPAKRRFCREILISGGILFILALGYYLPLYSKLRAGQSWGISIESAAQWFSFAAKTLLAQLPPVTALLAISGIFFYPLLRKLFLVTLLPLVLAIITKGGPERVYLILTPVYIIVAGMGFAALLKRFNAKAKWFWRIFAAGCALNFFLVPEVWKIPTPTADLIKAMQNTPEDTLLIMPATSGFPILANSRNLNERLEERIHNPLSYLLMINTPQGKINGANEQGGEAMLTVDLPAEYSPETGGYLYRLTPLADFDDADKWLLVIFNRRHGLPGEFIKMPGEKLRLNIWLQKQYVMFVYRNQQKSIPRFEGAKYYVLGENK